MTTYKRVLIGLVILIVGFSLGNLERAVIKGSNTPQNHIMHNGYKMYDLAQSNLQITTAGRYYVTCSTTSTPYRIIVDYGVKSAEIVLENVNIDVSKEKKLGGIEVNGKAIIILKGDNSVLGAKEQTGVVITGQGNLTISEQSTGTLTVKGSSFAGAIGGPTSGSGGRLYINGGSIQAYTSGCNAAIGSAAGSGNQGMRSIVINGGNIYCEVLNGGGAGIGGGTMSTVPLIEINGGHIVIKAGHSSRAIGSGYQYRGDEESLKIMGGQVIVYQGKLLEAEYISPIKLEKYTTIGNKAIIVAIERGQAPQSIGYCMPIDMTELKTDLRLVIEEIGLAEEIHLEEKGFFINVYSADKKYFVTHNDGKNIYLQSEVAKSEVKTEEDTKEEGSKIEDNKGVKEEDSKVEEDKGTKEEGSKVEDNKGTKEEESKVEDNKGTKEEESKVEDNKEIKEENPKLEDDKNIKNEMPNTEDKQIEKENIPKEEAERISRRGHSSKKAKSHKDFDWKQLNHSNKTYYISYGVKRN